MNCFIYDWRESDEEYEDEGMRLVIRGYGITEENKDVVIVVDNFTPFMYIELPKEIVWTKTSLNTLQYKIEEVLGKNIVPKKYSLVYKKKLYDYNEPDTTFPFLFVMFGNKTDRMNASRRLMNLKRPFFVYGKPVKIRCHEHEASPLLQFLSYRDLPSNGWVKVEKKGMIQSKTMFCDYEVHSSYQHIQRYDKDEIPPTRIISFDLEVYSSNPNKMPNANNVDDVIFQISCIYHYKSIKHNYLLTLGTVDIPHSTTIQYNQLNTIDYRDYTIDYKTIICSCKDEPELMMAFHHLIQKLNPHVIIGYNIFGFDLPYMMDRAILHDISHPFRCGLGKQKNVVVNEKLVSWTSSAYQNQEFRFLDLDGRILIDLLPIVRRDYKLRNYKLATVSSHFLGSSKDPVTPQDIFKFFARSQKKQDILGTQLLTCIGKYCIRDSILVMDLFYKLETWIGLLEMAKLCNTSIQTLYTQGQQIKVFSQIYKQCLYKNIVVESSFYHKNEVSHYSGAFVFDPVPSLYDNIIPFDFSSLYPTTIIAYNIDYTTFVTHDKIPDEKCHIIEWTEDEKHYRFRFIKEPKGILPTLLEDLLNQRKKTKYQMKTIEKGSLLYTVLDKRQLAYKISANSMYGAMGVTKGYLPFLPGAMCTTAKGRQSIQKAAEFIQQEYNGKLIYGDTDSIYCHFPFIQANELWRFALQVEKEFLKLFPPPMKLVFEEKVYSRFLIFTKKRYIALTQNEDLTVDKDLTIRGVLLARRDNCHWIRNVYENVVRKIMNEKCDWHLIEYFLIQEFNKLCSHFWDSSNLTITKQVGKDYAIRDCPGFDPKTHQITDDKKWSKRMKELNISTKDKGWMKLYRERTMPAHAQLAERMKRRGTPIEIGSRLEYLMIRHDNHKAKTFQKIEDPVYQKEYSNVLQIDFLYILHLLSNPMDQLLKVVFKKDKFVASQYNLRLKKQQMHLELTSIFSPKITFFNPQTITPQTITSQTTNPQTITSPTKSNEELQKMKIPELRIRCKEMGITGISKMKKEKLIECLVEKNGV